MSELPRRAAILSAMPFLFAGHASAASLPLLRVFKNIGCACCDAWVSHLRAAGLSATISERPDLAPVRRTAGVPDDLAGCHTAFAGRWIVEGHVPAAAVAAFLGAPLQWRGVAVAGMPLGSPGMEVQGQMPEPYVIWAFDETGHRQPFARAVGTKISLV